MPFKIIYKELQESFIFFHKVKLIAVWLFKYFNYNIPIYIGEMDDFHNLFDINSINEFRNDDKLDNIYRIVQQYL